MIRTLRQAYSFRDNFRSLYIRPNQNYGAIDGMRGLSMILVLAYHAFRGLGAGFDAEGLATFVHETPNYYRWVWNADKSVDVFFVISGFLIAMLLFGENYKRGSVGFGGFYLRRFLRLTPVYLFGILIYWVTKGPNYENLWANLLYVNNFLPLSEQAMPWCWSLAVEEQFYLVMPLFVVFVFFRIQQRMLALIVLFGMSFVINHLVVLNDDIIWGATLSELLFKEGVMEHGFTVYYDNLYTRYGCFVTGIGAAYLHYYHSDKLTEFFSSSWRSLIVTFLSVGTFAYLIVTPIADPQLTYGVVFKYFHLIASRPVFGLAMAGMILIVLYPRNLSKVLNSFLACRIWYPIAQLSYSMYIFHFILLYFVVMNFKLNLEARNIDFTLEPYFWAWSIFGVALILTMLVAMLTFLFIEKPFMNLRRGYRASMKPAGSPDS